MKFYTTIHICAIRIMMVLLIMGLNACAIQPGPSSGGLIRETVDVDSDVENAFHEAVKLLREEKYDDAIVVLNSVVEREKGLTAPYINLAMIYRHKGEEKKAEENLKMALAIDPAQPVANNELGIIYRKQGRFDEAKKAYMNALVDYPDYLPVIKNLGILCDLYMRDAVCALEQFEKYQEHMPDDETIKIWIADVKSRS